jgi:hypothetical protein
MLVASKPYIIEGSHDTGAPIHGPYSSVQVIDVSDTEVDEVCERIRPYLHKLDDVTELVWASGQIQTKLLDILSEALGAHIVRFNAYGATGFSDAHVDTVKHRMPNLVYWSFDAGVVDGMFTRDGVLRWGKSIDVRRFLRNATSEPKFAHLRELTMGNAATFTDDEIRQLVAGLPALQTLRIERAQRGTALAAVPPESFEAKELNKQTNAIVFNLRPHAHGLHH